MEKSTKVLMLTGNLIVLILQLVEKKLARGISGSEIADALEETEETIRQLVNKLQQA